MFLGGTYLALKNISIIREIGPPTILKATFIGVPMILYAGASISLYQAYNMLKDYQAETAVWQILDNDDEIFKGRSEEEINAITVKVASMIS